MKLKYTSILLAAITMASCQKEDASASSETTEQVNPKISEVLESVPEEESQDIHVVRETAKTGDTVTVKGRIMGSKEPFVDGRAAFMIADNTVITACNERPDDPCKTPWDACCDTPEDKQKAIAFVQIVDDEGNVIRESMEGVDGLENLARLVVTGTVEEGLDKGRFVITAKAIKVVE